MEEWQIDFIDHLIESGAFRVGTFKLKSDRMSPYFINMGIAVRDGIGLSTVCHAYASALLDTVGDDALEWIYIHGPAYKGIPIAAGIAMKLYDMGEGSVRWGYDRKERKEHGDKKDAVLVAEIRSDDNIIVVDDVITTGDTKLASYELILGHAKDSGIDDIKLKGVLVGVDREEKGSDGGSLHTFFTSRGVDLWSVVTITDVFNYLEANPALRENRGITDADIARFEKYFEEYGAREVK